jgi:probable rRNA maturation factor
MAHKVLIKNKQKEVKVPSGLRILIRRSCNAALELEPFDRTAEISITFVNNAEIALLNAQYRKNPNPTDVLSFPLGENGEYDKNMETGAVMLGDIVISMEKALEQSHIYGHSLQREVAFLTVHSVYHLLGYNHENGGIEAMKMRDKEETALYKLGLPRTAVHKISEEG